MRRVLVFGIGLVCVFVPWGTLAQTRYSVFGLGSQPCATWIVATEGQPLDVALRNWIAGYLSGWNAASSAQFPGFEVTAGFDISIVWEAVRERCHRAPQTTIEAATRESLIMLANVRLDELQRER
jgi:hypothetical protein